MARTRFISSPAPHPIFDDIRRGDLEAVQQRVLGNAAVLEERNMFQYTPLMDAIRNEQRAIALWLIQHRGLHDMGLTDGEGRTALHLASSHGPLEVVEALVGAGANPAAFVRTVHTPLMIASYCGHIDIAAFLLLQLPTVKASVDTVDRSPNTALSWASSSYGNQPVVQLLLDAGADPTIPAGHGSPLRQALDNNQHAIAALLRHTIAEADRARALHKARSLLGAGATALVFLQGRVERREAMPEVRLLTPQQQQLQLHQQEEKQQQENNKKERVRATAAYAAGVSDGEKDTGLCEDLYLKLLGYMLPAWADKGPAADDDSESSDENWGSEDDHFDESSGGDSGSESEEN